MVRVTSLRLVALALLNELPHLFNLGIYLVTFFLCMRVLLFTADQMTLKRLRDINWPMVVVAFLMGLFATLDGTFVILSLCDSWLMQSSRVRSAA